MAMTWQRSWASTQVLHHFFHGVWVRRRSRRRYAIWVGWRMEVLLHDLHGTSSLFGGECHVLVTFFRSQALRASPFLDPLGPAPHRHPLAAPLPFPQQRRTRAQ